MYRIKSLAFFLFTINMACSLEPQCSPFHYQEQMIEKMVKLEILVQKMKDDVTLIKQQVIDEIENLNAEKKIFKSEMETEKASMKNDLKQIMNKNDVIMKNISLEVEKLTEANHAEMKKHAREVQAIKDSTLTQTVAFLAKDVTNTALVNGVTLIYKTTVLNEGNGYDNTTGRFTAPLDGTYLFTAQFCLSNGSGNYIYYAIVLDGTEIKRGYFRDFDTFNCYTADVITVLKKGALVWVSGPLAAGSLFSTQKPGTHSVASFYIENKLFRELKTTENEFMFYFTILYCILLYIIIIIIIVKRIVC